MTQRFNDCLYRTARALVLGALFGVALYSSPAHAVVITTDPAVEKEEALTFSERWAKLTKEYGFLADLSELGIATADFLSSSLDDTSKKITLNARANVFGDSMLNDIMIKAADSENAVYMNAVKTKEDMKYAAEHASAGSGHSCRALLLHELATTTEEFEDGITTMLMSAMQYMYRGGEPGNNAQFAANLMDQRLKNKFGSIVDGYPAEYVDMTTKIGPFERSFVDADISPYMLDGSVTLEVPPVKNYTQTMANGQPFTYSVLEPEAGKPEQKAFVAAFNYCINLVGPRPSPPHGKDMFTAVGIVDADIFSQGLAIESGLDEQCSRLVAAYTRPNKTQMSELVTAQNARCEAARKSSGVDGILSNKTIVERFGDCKLGLSPHQAQLLGHSVCKSLDHYSQLYISGALTPPLMKETMSCSASWNMWQKNVITQQGTLAEAVEGQMNVKKLWTGMSGAKSSGYANTSMNLYSYVLDDKMDLPESRIRTVNAIEKRKPASTKGVPVSVDEIDLPQVASP